MHFRRSTTAMMLTIHDTCFSSLVLIAIVRRKIILFLDFSLSLSLLSVSQRFRLVSIPTQKYLWSKRDTHSIQCVSVNSEHTILTVNWLADWLTDYSTTREVKIEGEHSWAMSVQTLLQCAFRMQAKLNYFILPYWVGKTLIYI